MVHGYGCFSCPSAPTHSTTTTRPDRRPRRLLVLFKFLRVRGSSPMVKKPFGGAFSLSLALRSLPSAVVTNQHFRPNQTTINGSKEASIQSQLCCAVLCCPQMENLSQSQRRKKMIDGKHCNITDTCELQIPSI